jgi:ABC-type multidrug transport system permease subunit
LTVVAEALPATTCVAGTTCFTSKNAEVLAAMLTPERISILLILTVKVAADAAVLVTTILVMIAVVADGTVYNVVLLVAAAVLARTLVVVAINYYPLYIK